MDERRVAEYFLVAGLPPNPVPLAEFSCDGANLKSTHSLPPVTDVGVVNRSLGEVIPDGYTCIENTVGGIVANLNHGVLRSQEIFLCYRRGRDKPPLVDIGVLLEGRERLLPDSQVVEFTVENHNANINPNGVHVYITYRRATEKGTCNELVVSDICLIMVNKGEVAPHSYCTIERNLNKGTMVGSDIFLCYRKSVNRTNYLAYKAGILDMYPLESRPSFPVPSSLALFCLPMGATLEAWPPQAASPELVFSTFVLTILPTSSTYSSDAANDGVVKVYGAAITFYERYPHDKLTPQQRQDLQLNDHFGRRNLIHTNKCICILSMWPFFDTFDRFLRYLHKMAHSYNHRVPIERYIWHMLERVPFPSPRRPQILIQLDTDERISLAQLEDSPIPLSGASFRKLVMCLRPEGCLQVLLYALTEQKILLHSLRPDVLTAVAEAFTMIIFPFHWQCPYIPLCPLGLSDLLDAPTPFLLGLDSRFFDLYDPPDDVICIDLDTNAISIPEDKKYLTTKLMPKKPARILRSSLEGLCSSIRAVEEKVQEHQRKSNRMLDQNIEADFKIKRKEQELEVEIQEKFLRFTANILKGYSQYLLPIITLRTNNDVETPSLFDMEGFVKSRDRAYQKFYEMLVSTQMFSKFIEERSFVSDKDVSLVFFDDCVEKVKEEEVGCRLLELEPALSEITFFLTPPEPPLHAPIDGYAYEGFPRLRQELFPVKEPSRLLPLEVSTPQKGTGFGSPGSPLARRSKHEVRSAQKLASKHYQMPVMWAKCLLSTCFSLWFAQLPAFISLHVQKGRVLDLAFHIVQRMQRLSLSHHDEVCYRVMMQLCGVYSKPVLAVKTFSEMRNAGIVPNAITYGYYNRALLESKGNPSNLLWSKLRNVVMSVRAFRQCGTERGRRRSLVSLDDTDKQSDSASRLSVESGTSLDSQVASNFKNDHLISDPGYCSISEKCELATTLVPPTSNTISACRKAVLTSASEIARSVPAPSPLSPPNPEPPPPISPGSSEGTGLGPSSSSSSSPTATVAYDTAPSSPLQSQPPASLPSTLLPTSAPLPTSLPTRPLQISSGLDFAASNALRRRLGSIVRSSCAGLSSGAQLALIETRPLLVNTAGLLMTSPLDGSYLNAERPLRERPTDLAEQLSETLEKYDQIQEPSMPMPTLFDTSHSTRSPPEYFRMNNYGKDEKIMKKLLQFVYPSDEPDPNYTERVLSSSNDVQGPPGDNLPKEQKPQEERSEEVPSGNGFMVDPEDSESTASDQSSATSGVKGFFSRGAPERISNLWRKGVKGADERIRGIWRKNAGVPRSQGARVDDAGAEAKRLSTDSASTQESQNSQCSMDKLNAPLETPNIVTNASDIPKEGVPLISLEKAPFIPLVSPKELIEGSGRHQVLAGDPLGALEGDPSMQDKVVDPSKQPLSTSVPAYQTDLDSKWGNRRVGIERSHTFTDTTLTCQVSGGCKSAATGNDDQAHISGASTSLWTLAPPFSGQEFNATPSKDDGTPHSDNDLSTDDSLLVSRPPSFKLTLSGTSSTLEFASCVASQGIKQASKHIETLRTQYIDPAMMELVSQGGFNYRKNELISGSLNSMRSAVTHFSKRCNILREAIIPTPSKINWRMDDPDEMDGLWSRRESYEGGQGEETSSLRRALLRPVTSDDWEVDRSLPNSWSLQGPFCLGIWITSCSRCHKCKRLLFDEEIMAGWRPDDSDLNTKCWHCNEFTLPLLTVTRYYLRHTPKETFVKVTNRQAAAKDTSSLGTPQNGSSKKSKKDSNRSTLEEDVIAYMLDKGKKLEPLTFPYLSPLVLRKELETMLGHEGDSCLTLPSFPDHHPILYWNMLWYFSRLQMPSHLPGLCLSSPSLFKDEAIHESWKEVDWRNVFVRCLWDNAHFHQELGSPLYLQWKENYDPSILVKALTPHRSRTSKDVLESMLTLLHVNQVERCLEIMIQSVKKQSADLHYNRYPIYRDLLFFLLTALPRNQINLTEFEHEFRREFEKSFPKHRNVLSDADAAPPFAAVFCRKYFFDLSL